MFIEFNNIVPLFSILTTVLVVVQNNHSILAHKLNEKSGFIQTKIRNIFLSVFFWEDDRSLLKLGFVSSYPNFFFMRSQLSLFYNILALYG